MENKYYTPEIEEFHVGFEFSYLNFNQRITHTVTREDLTDADYSGSTEIFDFITGKPLVKYLDKKDIESLGWKGQKENSVYFTKDNHRLVHWVTNDKIGRSISIFEKYNGYAGELEEECLVKKLIIKNKSELKKLLKQLGIWQN